MRDLPPNECGPAREAVSARLDGELAELDEVRLEAHLHECADCRAFDAGAGSLAGALRGASLEVPTTVAFSSARARQLGRLPLRIGAAAAAAAAVAVVSLGVGQSLRPDASAPPPGAFGGVYGAATDMEAQHVLALLPLMPPGNQMAKPGRDFAV